jgi:hypothetical protein
MIIFSSQIRHLEIKKSARVIVVKSQATKSPVSGPDIKE